MPSATRGTRASCSAVSRPNGGAAVFVTVAPRATLGVAMGSDATRQEVIDADGHVVEPDTVWSDYSEPEFRDRLDMPGGGVQALGIGRAYPAVAALPLPDKDDDEFWAAEVGGEGWDEDSRSKM